jgi:hypothetical protein
MINGFFLNEYIYYHENLSIFYTYYFYFKHGLSKSVSCFVIGLCLNITRFILKNKQIINGDNNNDINDIFNLFIFSKF